MKDVVYTAIFNNYDKIKPLDFIPSEMIDYICFTDDSSLKAKGWKVIIIKDRNTNSTDLNRRLKIRVLDYLGEYNRSLYLDGNIKILSDLAPLFRYVKNNFFSACRHRDRDCLYQEAEELIKSKRVEARMLESQVQMYRDEGFPEHFGMTENCILIRNHLDKSLAEFQEAWWKEYVSGVPRDQISLPYVLWKYNYDIMVMDFDPRKPNRYLRWYQHSKKYRGKPLKKIRYHLRSVLNHEWRNI